MRSFLFVPADSIAKFRKASTGEADALILDLEDSVAPDAKDKAREMLAEMLKAPRNRQQLFVRVNALDTGLSLTDLVSAMPHRPDGIVLPKSAHGDDVGKLAAWLDALEAAYDIEAGTTDIIAIVTETPESLFNLGSYKDASPRLAGMMWGAEDLAAAFGATHNRTGDGFFAAPFLMARNLCLAGAAAAGVMAIDTVCTNIGDVEALLSEVREARRDGFGAKAVIHPSHVDPVNRAFTPTSEEVDWARRVAAAFTDEPAAGVIRIDGKMVDRPHQRQARKILEAARSVRQRS
ncbi:Citryl-CoA lyase [Rhizobium sp. CF080]|uniref:HpcH/HpaI aldolase/citrate lyase family protein n=1 Tax=Rhizobium sp. (strain CF080) TaxID=1144310 RepID=UPI0003E80368|nr:CoA ester lyase [Rhizobium sp. CF080]EUB99843.1 Citryl-CoA lyase [Rhizobium sp. CF080]